MRVLDIGTEQYATGRVIRGVVAGSCYLRDRSYKGNADAHWRRIVVLNEGLSDSRFSVMWDVTLAKLCGSMPADRVGSCNAIRGPDAMAC